MNLLKLNFVATGLLLVFIPSLATVFSIDPVDIIVKRNVAGVDWFQKLHLWCVRCGEKKEQKMRLTDCQTGCLTPCRTAVRRAV